MCAPDWARRVWAALTVQVFLHAPPPLLPSRQEEVQGMFYAIAWASFLLPTWKEWGGGGVCNKAWGSQSCPDLLAQSACWPAALWRQAQHVSFTPPAHSVQDFDVAHSRLEGRAGKQGLIACTCYLPPPFQSEWALLSLLCYLSSAALFVTFPAQGNGLCCEFPYNQWTTKKDRIFLGLEFYLWKCSNGPVSAIGQSAPSSVNRFISSVNSFTQPVMNYGTGTTWNHSRSIHPTSLSFHEHRGHEHLTFTKYHTVSSPFQRSNLFGRW